MRHYDSLRQGAGLRIVSTSVYPAGVDCHTACVIKTVLSVYTIYLFLSTLFTEGTAFMKHVFSKHEN